MRFPRSSGLLMPVFSLPNDHGIGDLGEAAFRFVDFLQSAGQSLWQLLPMGPAARGNSPYSSYSAFAGSPLFISMPELVQLGLLTQQDVEDNARSTAGNTAPESQEQRPPVDYAAVRQSKKALLHRAFQAFQNNDQSDLRQQFENFCQTKAEWLQNFVLFEALAIEQDDFDWSHWDSDLAGREESALLAAADRLADEMQFSRFEQFLFHKQWHALKEYANARGIRIYGDMPIFVAYESVDVWANQHLYQLGSDRRPTVVAGVPPDYFSETGQMWGNPLYAWQQHADLDYSWWIRRLKQALESFDLLRLDHFRGFESYWQIPAAAKDATSGQWQPAPGDALFGAVRKALGDVPIVAEDLGLITEEVHQLRARVGFPGMRVLQFGFEHQHDAYHRPECYPEDSVAYTGTHDNETLMGWFNRRLAEGTSQKLISPLLSSPSDGIHIDLITAVAKSDAHTVIFPVQDVLGLGNEARVNTPGEPDGNWEWHCPSGVLTTELATLLRRLSSDAGRT
ncbi:MAG: 4-alpha-glucanotransferase [Fuerstiella sp.]